MNLFDLAGKTTIITGLSRGIGRAIAKAYAQAGARVVISSRKVAACEAVAETINDEHGAERAIAIPASISSTSDLENLVAETRRRGEGSTRWCATRRSESALRSIAWGGRFLVVGFPAVIPRLHLNPPLLKGV